MEIYEALYTTRAMQRLKPDPIPREVQAHILDAASVARAEGIGSTLTGVLQTFFAAEVCDILGAPKDAGWYLHGVVPMGYPTGKWGVGVCTPVHMVAARNHWQGDLGFTVPEPLWPT